MTPVMPNRDHALRELSARGRAATRPGAGVGIMAFILGTFAAGFAADLVRRGI